MVTIDGICLSWKCTIPSPTSGPALRISPLPVAEFQHRRSVVYVFGGEGGDGTFRENEAYDPALGTWQAGLGSAVVHGRIHVISGGPTPGGSLSDLHEVFIPPEQSTSKPGDPLQQQDKAGQ